MVEYAIMPIKISLSERFWQKVDVRGPDDCWTWLATRHPRGYGFIWFEGRNHYAHRISWLLENGPIPEGMGVCHHCDNTFCVNPAHLFLGTQADNSRDAAKKGRLERGAGKTKTKLTRVDVLEIRRRYREGRRRIQLDLAREFGLSESHIGKVVKRNSWAWLKEE